MELTDFDHVLRDACEEFISAARRAEASPSSGHGVRLSMISARQRLRRILNLEPAALVRDAPDVDSSNP